MTKKAASPDIVETHGPVGLEGLVIYKWKLRGSGQIVADYSGPSAKKFKHRMLGTGHIGDIC